MMDKIQSKEISSSGKRERVLGLHKMLKIRLIEKNTFGKRHLKEMKEFEIQVSWENSFCSCHKAVTRLTWKGSSKKVGMAEGE